MLKAFRFRLYPTKAQRTRINEALELLRWVYNETLACRKNSWEQEKRSISVTESNKLLTGWKKQHLELNGVYSQVLQDEQVRVDLAFQAFFRRVKTGQDKVGFPRFKGYMRYDSLTYTQFGFKVEENRLALSKIGVVRVNMHRKVVGKVHRVTVRRSSTGKFFVSIVTEVEAKVLPFKDGFGHRC
jgi:putative transposase